MQDKAYALKLRLIFLITLSLVAGGLWFNSLNLFFLKMDETLQVQNITKAGIFEIKTVTEFSLFIIFKNFNIKN